MQEPLFQTFSQLLDDAESVTFGIVALKDGRLRVTVIPRLKDAGDTGSDDALRAALAMPLVVTETPERLDAGFPALLREYTQQRVALQSSLSTLDALKEANRQAASKVDKAQRGADSKAAGKDAPAGKAPEKPSAACAASTRPAASATALSDDDLLL